LYSTEKIMNKSDKVYKPFDTNKVTTLRTKYNNEAFRSTGMRQIAK